MKAVHRFAKPPQALSPQHLQGSIRPTRRSSRKEAPCQRLLGGHRGWADHSVRHRSERGLRAKPKDIVVGGANYRFRCNNMAGSGCKISGCEGCRKRHRTEPASSVCGCRGHAVVQIDEGLGPEVGHAGLEPSAIITEEPRTSCDTGCTCSIPGRKEDHLGSVSGAGGLCYETLVGVAGALGVDKSACHITRLVAGGDPYKTCAGGSRSGSHSRTR